MLVGIIKVALGVCGRSNPGDLMPIDEHRRGHGRCVGVGHGLVHRRAVVQDDSTGEQHPSAAPPVRRVSHTTSTIAKPRGRLLTDSKPSSVQMTMSSMRAPNRPVS